MRNRPDLPGRISSPGPNGDDPTRTGRFDRRHCHPQWKLLTCPGTGSSGGQEARYILLHQGRKTLAHKTGQRMLFSLGWQIVYKRETRTRKPTLKSDTQSQMARKRCVTQVTSWMEYSVSKQDGVLPVESRRAGGVPGPVPQRGPPQATGGHPVPMRGARLRRRRVNATDRKNMILAKPQGHSTFCSGMLSRHP